MLFDLYNGPPERCAPWAPYMMIFFKRLLDSGFVQIVGSAIQSFTNGVKTSPDYLIITPLGREFIADLGMDEL